MLELTNNDFTSSGILGLSVHRIFPKSAIWAAPKKEFGFLVDYHWKDLKIKLQLLTSLSSSASLRLFLSFKLITTNLCTETSVAVNFWKFTLRPTVLV